MELKEIAREIAKNIGFDGMIFYVLENGRYGITTEGSGYWPVPKLWETNLSKWYWDTSLADAGISLEDTIEASDELVDYVLEVLEIVDWNR